MKAVVVVSDLHNGSIVGLCPPNARMDEGGGIKLNKFQKTLYRYWRNFWDVYVPKVTQGAEKVIVVQNGDAIDGVHHDTVALWTNDVDTQRAAAVALLQPLADRYTALKLTRGSPAHDGVSGKHAEAIARELQCARDTAGNYASWQLWLKVDRVVFNIAHHIGTTSSAAYESSAPMRELVAALVEAAQWGQPLPRVVVRSHRHRFIPVSIPSKHGRIECVITPGWQLRTPFVERIDRLRKPHIGGVVFLVEGDQCQVLEKLYPTPDPKPEQI